MSRNATATSRRTIIVFAGTCCVAAVIYVALFFLPVVRHVDMRAKDACFALMKQIAGAKGSWALEHNKTADDIPRWEDLVGREKYLWEIPQCPNGGTYIIGRICDPPMCSVPHDDQLYKECMGLAPRCITAEKSFERSRTSTNAYERQIRPANTN